MGDKSLTSETAVAYPSCTMPIHSIKHKVSQPLSLVAPCFNGARKAVWNHHDHLWRDSITRLSGKTKLFNIFVLFLTKKTRLSLQPKIIQVGNISQIGSGLWPLPDFASWAYLVRYAQPCALFLPAYSAHLLTRVVAEYPINLMVWQSSLNATAHDHATML